MSVLAIATYNVWGGGEPWRYTAERGVVRGAVPGSRATTLRPDEGIWPRRRRLLADVLRRAHSDVVGLQEAVGEAPVAEGLAYELGYHVTSSGGLAVLSRFPIVGSEYIPLPSPPIAEMQQCALIAEIAAPAVRVEVVTLHVTPRDDKVRLAALDELLSRLGSRRPLVMGDFNAQPGSAALRLMAEAGWRDAWPALHPSDPGATMPSHAPVARIDYLLLPPGVEALSATRLGDQPDADGFYPSDHLGLAATVRLPDRPG